MTHVDIFGKSDVRFGKFPESIESQSKTKVISHDYLIPANQQNHVKDSDIITTNLIVDSRDRLHDDYANPSKYTIKLPDTITNIVNIFDNDMKNVCSHLMLESKECGCRHSFLRSVYECVRIIDKKLRSKSVKGMELE